MKKQIAEKDERIQALERQIQVLIEERDLGREMEERREQQREAERRYEFYQHVTDEQTIEHQTRILRQIESDFGGLVMEDFIESFNNYAPGGPLLDDEE